MKKDELYAKILGTSVGTYYNYLKEERKIIKFLGQFTLDELEEFHSTGKINSLVHYKVWKNSNRPKINIALKLHNLLTGKNGNFIYNEKMIDVVCELLITFKQMRNESLIPTKYEQVIWNPNEITFNELYNLYLLTRDKGNLFESLGEENTPKYIFEDLQNLSSITDDESNHLAYLLEDQLLSFVTWIIEHEHLYISQVKGLVILSLIIMSSEWFEDLSIKEVVDLAIPNEVIEKITKTSSYAKLLKIYEAQVKNLMEYDFNQFS